MKKLRRTVWASAAVAAGAVAVRQAKEARQYPSDGERWLTVTINRSPADVGSDKELPPPLDRHQDRLDVRIRPAPGDRGTELSVRLKEAPGAVATSAPARLAGADPRQEIRQALREAKALLETGEVMLPDSPPTTRDTPGGRIIGLVTRRSGGEGVL